jgi:hypothetical protein
MDCRFPLDNSSIPRFGTDTAVVDAAEFKGEGGASMVGRISLLLIVLALVALAATLGGAPWGPG